MPTDLPQRKRLRYDGYDYRKSGAYFVTICVEDKLPLLGQSSQNTIILSEAGNMVTEVWLSLPDAFPSVKLDTFVAMPNHIHFVLWLTSPLHFDNNADSDLQNVDGRVAKTPSLPDVLRWFKSLTTAKYRQGVRSHNWPTFPGKLWQRSYYEHVVRSDEALYAIRSYILSNPQRWLLDRYHPDPSGIDEDAMALWRLLQGQARLP